MPPKQPATTTRPKSNTKTKEKRKDADKAPEVVASREQILEREIMMLRKNLNMAEIMKEFRKAVPEKHMQTMFFETLHELELKLKTYESGTGLPVSGSLSDLQKDLDKERATVKTQEQEIKEKNRMIDDNRKLLNEKDKALKQFDTELQLQKAHSRKTEDSLKEEIDIFKRSLRNVELELDRHKKKIPELLGKRHASESNEKLRQLQTQHEALQKKMIEKELAISTLSEQIENLKKKLAEAEGSKMTLKEEMTEVEQLRSELRDITQREQKCTEEINELTKQLQQSKGRCLETEAKFKENQKLLEERNEVIKRLNNENNLSSEEDDRKENEMSKLRKTIENREKSVKELEEKMLKEMADNKKEMTELRKTVEEKERTIKELEEQISNESSSKEKELLELRHTLHEKTERFKALEEEKQKLSNAQTEKEKELSKLIDTLSQKEKRIEELEKTLNASGKRTDDEGSLKEKTDEINRLKTELTESKQAHEKTRSEKEKLEFTCHDAFDKLEKKEKAMKQQQQDHSKLILRKDETIQKLRKEKTMVDPTGGGKANIETKSLVDKYEKTEKELKNAKNEIDELKNRLSKVVGANIMNENPNITDLSDENRPTKLSEKFSELYDNEWTDAYEEVEKEFRSEEKIIDHLLKTLEDIFDFCKTISHEHANNIQACILTIPYAANGRPKSAKIDVTTQRQLKELRKSFAPYLVDRVFQHFTDTMKIKLTGKTKTEKFMKKCVEVCWLMSSQDPPVILDTANVKGKEFDIDTFRSYTKTGKVVDYMVWPPMLLHKGGQLLCKGVAQAK